MDSGISDLAQKYEISDLREITMFENFFQKPDIVEELGKAEKYRKIRYGVLIAVVLIVILWIFYLNGSRPYLNGSRPFIINGDTILPLIILPFIIIGITIRIFWEKIEGSIKKKVLPYFSKELLDDLKYDAGNKYAFSIHDLVSAGFLNSYDNISTIEDSIGFHIHQDNKHIIVQGFEIKTTKSSRRRGTRATTSNHCYIMKVRFPQARIKLSDNLIIRPDKSDKLLTINWIHIMLIGFGSQIGFLIGIAFAEICRYFVGKSILSISIPVGCMIIGGILCSIYLGKNKKGKRVYLENQEFEKFFDVSCNDQVGSRMIITPAFMDRLVKLASKKQYQYELLYQNDCFYVKWDVKSNYLEVNTWKNIRKNMETFIAWYAQMRDIIMFIFDMRMVYFSKTSMNAVLDQTKLEFESFQENSKTLILRGTIENITSIGNTLNTRIINIILYLVRFFRK